jgi:hypothetical protein
VRTGERNLLRVPGSHYLTTLAWSPDGGRIAGLYGNENPDASDLSTEVVVFDSPAVSR